MTVPETEIRTVPPKTDPTEERPFAIAVRIGTWDIWIGNQWATNPEYLDKMDLELSHIVALNHQPGEATTDHHELHDSQINDLEDFATAADIARKRYREDGSLMISCAAGISRSVTIAATVLSAEEEISFEKVLTEIQSHRERADPHPKLRLNALYYLFDNEDRKTVEAKLESLLNETDIQEDDCNKIHTEIDVH